MDYPWCKSVHLLCVRLPARSVHIFILFVQDSLVTRTFLSDDSTTPMGLSLYCLFFFKTDLFPGGLWAKSYGQSDIASHPLYYVLPVHKADIGSDPNSCPYIRFIRTQDRTIKPSGKAKLTISV